MSRYAAYAASLVLTLACLWLARIEAAWWWGAAIFGGLSALGTLDLLQRRSRELGELEAGIQQALDRQSALKAEQNRKRAGDEQRAVVVAQIGRARGVRPGIRL